MSSNRSECVTLGQFWSLIAGSTVRSLWPCISFDKIQLLPLLYVTNKAGRHFFQKKERRTTAEPRIQRCMNSPQMSAGGRPGRANPSPSLSNTRCRSLNAAGAGGGGVVWTACVQECVCVLRRSCAFFLCTYVFAWWDCCGRAHHQGHGL